MQYKMDINWMIEKVFLITLDKGEIDNLIFNKEPQ